MPAKIAGRTRELHMPLNSNIRPHMIKSLPPDTFRLALLACGLAFVFLLLAVLPVALYQYLAISTPEFLSGFASAVWSAYLSPLTLLPSLPVLRSNDPLISLVPSFGIMFCLWSLLLFALLVSFRWRRCAV